MKKYLFGLMAILFAVASVAFTNVRYANEKNFKFIGSVSDDTEVQDPHMWETYSQAPTCSDENVEACVILEVPDTYYHQVSPGVFQLNNATDGAAPGKDPITITAGGTSVFYVASVDAGTEVNNDPN